MRDYTFHTMRGRVIVKDDELVLPASQRHSHWPKAEVAAVTIEGLVRVQAGAVDTYGVVSHDPGHHPVVNVTRADGTSRQFEDVTESALELASQLNLRGYPVSA